MATTETRGVILIRNGRVYDQDGNVDLPPIADLLIVDGLIAAVRPGIARAVERRGDHRRAWRTRDRPDDRRNRQAVDAGLRQCALSFARRSAQGLLRDHPARTVAAERAAPELSETQHRRDPRAHVARRARMPAQRNDDGSGPVHDLPVRRRAPRGDPAGLRGHRNPLRLRAAIRRQGGREARFPSGRRSSRRSSALRSPARSSPSRASICRACCATSWCRSAIGIPG